MPPPAFASSPARRSCTLRPHRVLPRLYLEQAVAKYTRPHRYALDAEGDAAAVAADDMIEAITNNLRFDASLMVLNAIGRHQCNGERRKSRI
jgi:hypothetical protein